MNSTNTQEPVAVVVRDENNRPHAVLKGSGADLPHGTELYATPVSTEPAGWMREDELARLPFMCHVRLERPAESRGWVPVFRDAPVSNATTAQAQPAANAEPVAEIINDPYDPNVISVLPLIELGWDDVGKKLYTAPVAAQAQPSGDRAMLLELMAAFDGEMWECPQCGHGEDTKDCDSAIMLREYLANNPVPAQAQPLPDSLIPTAPDLEYLRSMADSTNLPAFLRGQIAAVVKALAAQAQPASGLDVDAVLRRFLTSDGFIAECDIQHIVAALTTQPAINGYICTVPDDCETLHWRGQILSMNELASVAQPAVGEEIHVHIEGRDVLTLPLDASGMIAPRFVVHVPAQTSASAELECSHCGVLAT